MAHPLHQFSFCPLCGSSLFEENNEKSKKCTQCGFTYYFNSSAAVVALIFNEQGELLVTRRAHEPAIDTLDLPGGFVDMHETAEQAVMREIKEELKLQVIKAQYCMSLPNIYLYSGFEVHTLDLFYKCQVASVNNFSACDDVSEAFFLSPDKIQLADFGLKSIRDGLQILIKNNFQAE